MKLRGSTAVIASLGLDVFPIITRAQHKSLICPTSGVGAHDLLLVGISLAGDVRATCSSTLGLFARSDFLHNLGMCDALDVSIVVTSQRKIASADTE